MERLILIQPITDWHHWLIEYRSSIRVGVEWDELIESFANDAPAAKTVNYNATSMMACLPHYRDGEKLVSWTQKNQPEVVARTRTGRFPYTILRVPAVTFGVGEYCLILDGCHRLKQLDPNEIMIDLLTVSVEQATRFVDFHSPWWRSLLEKP